MIFWIALAVVVILVGLLGIAMWRDGEVLPFLGPTFVGTVIVAGVALVCASVGAALGSSSIVTDRAELAALSNGSSVQGSFFLGSGRVDGKRVLNYVEQHDGYSTLEQVDADDSRIYEDEPDSPYLVTQWEVRDTSWVWWPWDFWGQPRYDFHIPADSIVESYVIDNTEG